MYLMKDNFIIKTVCAYAKLFRTYFPVYYVLFTVLGMFSYFGLGAKYFDIDFFKLFVNSKSCITIKHISIISFIIILSSNLFIFISVYLGIIKLNKFLLNVLNQNPFVEENGKNLKFIGHVIVMISVFVSIKDALISPNIIQVPAYTNILMKLALSLTLFFSPYLILGLFIIVIGEVIVRGTEMKNELDLTV